jgi:hypothetical protein
MMDWSQHFREIWAVDFEFQALTGERPAPRCMVARELKSGRLVRLWFADGGPTDSPFGTGPEVLFLAYYASAELGCFLALNWPLPARILDLFAEFRNLTNGLAVPCGKGLLGALAYFGLPALDGAEKESMRHLAMRDGPYTDAERVTLLDYCQTDVDALVRLLPAMESRIDFPRALFRGRYMAAAARMEWNGVPLDVQRLDALRSNWEAIKRRLVSEMDPRGEIFERADRRAIDPQSRLGAAILQEAAAWDIDPQDLADAVEDVWKRHRETTVGRVEVIKSARHATGLTADRARRWEDAGLDHSTWKGLDTVARELAGQYPELAIGHGYDPDAPDADDHAGRLWEVLREPTPAVLPRHHSGILHEAAELVAAAGPGPHYFGPMRFSMTRFAEYLASRCIPWPRLPSGALALDDDTFRDMAKLYPDAIGPIRELRYALSQLRLHELAVGADGRNRLILSAFASRTGRNQPSNSRFIFGPSVWLRSLIQPAPGRAVAYVDWSGQEYGIAAALSGDTAMQIDYASGDPYLAFGRRIGAVPTNATKLTHQQERDRLKVCCGLGAMYGAGSATVAATLGIPEWQARDWLRAHREAYATYWRWSDSVVDEAMLTGRLRTVFGWTLHIGPDVNPRSIRNFPMQANGAEMMRLAACLLTERGVMVCAPVHDAFLVEANADEIDSVVEAAQRAMREAGEIVLGGFQLRTDAKIVRYPERYSDPRGSAMWNTVEALLVGIPTQEDLYQSGTPTCTINGTRTCTKMVHPSHSFFLSLKGSF